MTVTTKLLIWILAGLCVFAAGNWVRGAIQAKRDLTELKDAAATQGNTAAGYDKTVTEKLQDDARIDAGVAANENQRRELKSHDPSYREYLDRPLPESSRRLYRDAAARLAAEHPGADGAVKADQ